MEFSMIDFRVNCKSDSKFTNETLCQTEDKLMIKINSYIP